MQCRERREGGEDEVDGVEKVGGKHERRFIIRDLQCQLQSIKEKNTKKDSLIRYRVFHLTWDTGCFI